MSNLSIKDKIETFCIAPHPHAQETNITQHSARGEIGLLHTETDAKSNADNKMQLDPQTVLWQIKKTHITKRKRSQKTATNTGPF